MTVICESTELFVLATRNKNKLAEIGKMFEKELALPIIGLDELETMLSITPGTLGDVNEDGIFYYENAYKKMMEVIEAIRNYSTQPERFSVLADDSGMDVEGWTWEYGEDITKGQSIRLSGHSFPGVDTKIFEEGIGGLEKAFDFYQQKSNGMPVVLIASTIITGMSADRDNDGNIFYGSLKGKLSPTMRGENGFGFDKFFIPDGYEITMAEMDMDQKNTISHRFEALKMLIGHIKDEIIDLKIERDIADSIEYMNRSENSL